MRIGNMVRASIFIILVIAMSDNGDLTKRMAKELSTMLMVPSIQVILLYYYNRLLSKKLKARSWVFV
jgi:hypothetical protein